MNRYPNFKTMKRKPHTESIFYNLTKLFYITYNTFSGLINCNFIAANYIYNFKSLLNSFNNRVYSSSSCKLSSSSLVNTNSRL